MKLLDVQTQASPLSTESTRITGNIACGNGERFNVWVDVPTSWAGSISTSGNPWLAVMLPMAASRGEPVQGEQPIDALLLENLEGVMAMWQAWHPQLKHVSIDMPLAPLSDFKPDKQAAFFSGGIDSHFTVARRLPGNTCGIPPVGKLDTLITVWGFDVGVWDEGIRPLLARLGDYARSLQLDHMVIRTNLREQIPEYRGQWGPLTCGVGMAFIGLLFEKYFGKIYLGSGTALPDLVPYGSHVVTDPRFSTATLDFVNDGAHCSRVEKTALLARLPDLKGAFHVCQASILHNCSRCEKCLRTMVTLDMLGQKDRFAREFDWSDYSQADAERVFPGVELWQKEWEPIMQMARNKQLTGLLASLALAKKRTRHIDAALHCLHIAGRIPGLWRLEFHAMAALRRKFFASQYIEHPPAGNNDAHHQG
jgi:hypothetical protein